MTLPLSVLLFSEINTLLGEFHTVNLVFQTLIYIQLKHFIKCFII
jgi:hypothetical protein